MAKKLSQEEVLKNILEIHGELYDLSNVIYVNKRTKIELKCKIHGSFLSSLDQVYRGQGCPVCGKSNAAKKRRVNFASFIDSAQKIHDNKYEYDELSYSKISAAVKIRCHEHGWFKQNADVHINQQQGCPDCGRISQISKRKMSRDEFVDKASDIHSSSNFDFTKVDYKNNHTKVQIRCPKHGLFFPTPSNLLQGSGCPTCGIEKVHEEQMKDLESFVADSKKVHGLKYDYSLVNYTGGKRTVQIICVNHGPFKQTPNAHQRGNGCPNCNTSRGEEKVKMILKNLDINFEQQYTFSKLVDKRKLKCDFFLPDFNLVIEFNGRQHYEPVNRFGGFKGFKETQRRDQIKRKFMKENNIDLLEIHYSEKEIEKIISTTLKID
jgi:predicted  nucleic acid-binding Zn-ribbon protein